MFDRIQKQLDNLQSENSLRSIPSKVDRGADLWLDCGPQRCLNLASNNYLGLAADPRLKEAAIRAIKELGTSSGASRLVSGQYRLYSELESTTARFKDQESALVVGSGYAANLSILTALAGRKTAVFSDRQNHASIVDGCILARCKQIRYRHLDTDHLRHLLHHYKDHAEKIIITDTVFSMDGDLAPLEGLIRMARDSGALLVVDEAHATGIFGKGRGLAAELGVANEVDVHMGTFSKALGSQGGYIAARRDIIRLIISKARAFIYSTALPPAVIAASLAALEHVRDHPEKGKRLLQTARNVAGFLRETGFAAGPGHSQIIPVIIGPNRETLQAAETLRHRGVYAPAIRPPTVPQNTARLRLSLRADLSDKDVDFLKKAFLNLYFGAGPSG
ncbi:MAG: aminotransferase class I/II-fold pyridoxal phosphate-dependent enzyme [Desulfonatronovibrionaceae bacterium]